MKPILMFYLDDCGYCQKAHRAMAELFEEKPAYRSLPITKIEESRDPETANRYDYYAVPTFYVDGEKRFEARIGMSYEAIKAANGGKGVLLVIKNYTGDVMNFEMAADMAADDGIEVEKVVVADDVAVENSTWTTGRRGIAGTIFVHKLAGACAEAGGDLQEVKRIAEKVIANVRSMGMAVDACTVPAAGKPSFDLAEDEIEIGIGIHGEPGVNREKISPVNDIADKLLGKILEEGIYNSGDEVAVMVNGMGGTPLMELFVANKHVKEVLDGKGIKICKTLVGNYMTSLDMEGFSITLLKVDDEMKKLLNAPADTPAFVQV